MSQTQSIFRENTPIVNIHHPSNRDRDLVPLLQYFVGDCIEIKFIYFGCNKQPYDLTEKDIQIFIGGKKYECEPLHILTENNGGVNKIKPSCGHFSMIISEEISEELPVGYINFWIELHSIENSCKETILRNCFEIMSVTKAHPFPERRSV